MVDHPINLCRQHFVVLQAPGVRYVHQLRVGRCAPQEVRQPSCQLLARQRLVAGTRGRFLDAIEKSRRDENCLESQPDGFLERISPRCRAIKQVEIGLLFGRLERSAKRPRHESTEQACSLGARRDHGVPRLAAKQPQVRCKLGGLRSLALVSDVHGDQPQCWALFGHRKLDRVLAPSYGNRGGSGGSLRCGPCETQLSGRAPVHQHVHQRGLIRRRRRDPDRERVISVLKERQLATHRFALRHRHRIVLVHLSAWQEVLCHERPSQSRRNHHVVQHQICHFQIALGQQWRQKKRLTVVVEALPARSVDREEFRDIDGNPGQIANGVLVLGAVESPDGHRAGIDTEVACAGA